MGSTVSVNTYTHSVTYVTDQLLGSMKKIIMWIGLDHTKFVNNWDVYERGVRTWLQSGHLEEVILEVTHSSKGLVARNDITIDYSYSGGDGNMWVDTDAIRHSIVKQNVSPSNCDYTISLRVKPNHPAVDGWGEGTLQSTSGFTRQSLGTTIGTHAIGASTSYWRKS